jgi:hypothetical protein
MVVEGLFDWTVVAAVVGGANDELPAVCVTLDVAPFVVVVVLLLLAGNEPADDVVTAAPPIFCVVLPVGTGEDGDELTLVVAVDAGTADDANAGAADDANEPFPLLLLLTLLESVLDWKPLSWPIVLRIHGR